MKKRWKYRGNREEKGKRRETGEQYGQKAALPSLFLHFFFCFYTFLYFFPFFSYDSLLSVLLNICAFPFSFFLLSSIIFSLYFSLIFRLSSVCLPFFFSDLSLASLSFPVSLFLFLFFVVIPLSLLVFCCFSPSLPFILLWILCIVSTPTVRRRNCTRNCWSSCLLLLRLLVHSFPPLPLYILPSYSLPTSNSLPRSPPFYPPSYLFSPSIVLLSRHAGRSQKWAWQLLGGAVRRARVSPSRTPPRAGSCWGRTTIWSRSPRWGQCRCPCPIPSPPSRAARHGFEALLDGRWFGQ